MRIVPRLSSSRIYRLAPWRRFTPLYPALVLVGVLWIILLSTANTDISTVLFVGLLLTSFCLLTDIHKPFDNLAGDAEAEIALHPRPYDAREAAYGTAYPRCRRQPDDGRLLPRVARGGSFLRGIVKCGECRRPWHRDRP